MFPRFCRISRIKALFTFSVNVSFAFSLERASIMYVILLILYSVFAGNMSISHSLKYENHIKSYAVGLVPYPFLHKKGLLKHNIFNKPLARGISLFFLCPAFLSAEQRKKMNLLPFTLAD